MKIKRCHIENFTVFEKQDIEFCKGINVIIGVNGAGKSHLLKILYAMIQSVPAKKEAKPDNADILRFYEALNGIFKPEDGEVNSMIRSDDRKTPAIFNLESDHGCHYAELRPDHHIARGALVTGQNVPRQWQPSQIDNPSGLFIPPNEVLAIYPGFASSYEKRELSFDQTYYDICKALSASPLRRNNIEFSTLINKFEDILSGKVIQKGDRFYIQNGKGKRTLEAHLSAEGHRKIAALAQLINNGSIDKDTILFWDEPEANLNPRLIRHVAESLLELAKIGLQTFIATHDYLLTGEISLTAEYNDDAPIRFHAMSRNGDDPVEIQSGKTLADLHDNAILDEFAAHYDREKEAIIKYMKTGGGE